MQGRLFYRRHKVGIAFFIAVPVELKSVLDDVDPSPIKGLAGVVLGGFNWDSAR